MFVRNLIYDNCKQSRDFKNFQRSESRPGWYRTNLRRWWVRPTRPTASFSKDKQGSSKSTERNFVSNKDLLEKITRIKSDVKELKQKFINVALIEEDETEVKDIFFTKEKEKADMMILDFRAPYSLFGKDWMEKWMKEHKISKDKLEKVECNKKFRFGPGRNKYVIWMVCTFTRFI